MSSYQLKIGRKIEREHLPLFRTMKLYNKMTGKCPSEKQFVEGIAKAHIKEDKNYYTKLKKAGL